MRWLEKLRALNLKKVGKVDTIRMKPEADYALEVND